MTTSKAAVVHVCRCGKCGLEYFSLRQPQPVNECGRCGSTNLTTRVIAKPHQNTIDQAAREDDNRANS